MKIQFDSNDDLPLHKMLKFGILTIITRNILEQDGKYYPQVFLDDCLYEIQILEYERIDISEGIDVNKSGKLKECDICHYWYFLDRNFNYEPYLCNGCHDLMQKTWYMSKDDAISIIHNSNLNDTTGVLYHFSLYIKNE